MPTSALLVVYDDVDLPTGTVRIRERGGPGTHNGMRSIVDEIGTTEFARLRIGVGMPTDGQKLADYVLGPAVPRGARPSWTRRWIAVSRRSRRSLDGGSAPR